MDSALISQMVLEAATPAFDELAEAGATADAASYLDPSTPSPTSGEANLGGEYGARVVALDSAQTKDEIQTRARIADRIREVTAYKSGEPVETGGALRVGIVPVEWLILGLLASVETIALRKPIETILMLKPDSWEGLFIAGAIASFAAVLADQFALHSGISGRSQGRMHVRQQGAAGLFAFAVFAIGLAAVLARVYAASLASQVDSGSGLDASGVAFFGLFQLAFVAVNLGLSTSLHHRVDRRWLTRLSAELEALRALAAALPALFANQHRELDDICRRALLRYRTDLAHHHDDVTAQLGWIDRTSRELNGGELFRSVYSSMPAGRMAPEAADEPAAGPVPPPPPDEPAMASPPRADAPGGNEPPPAPEPPADAVQPDIDLTEPAGAGPDAEYLNEDDLFAAILNEEDPS